MIDKELLWRELAGEPPPDRKVRKRTVVGFWCALAFIAAFILGCWVVS
jgi:hypothetical protein